MKPIEVYQTYLALKNHFTKDNYDFFKYRGKSRVSNDLYRKRFDEIFKKEKTTSELLREGYEEEKRMLENEEE